MVINGHKNQHIKFEFQTLKKWDVFHKLYSEPSRLICLTHAPIFPEIPTKLIDLLDTTTSVVMNNGETNIEYCNYLLAEEGFYFMEITREIAKHECAIYLLAPPHYKIEFQMVHVNFKKYCHHYGQSDTHIDFFDGWQYNQDYIPINEHLKKSFKDRMETTCAYSLGQEMLLTRKKKIFHSTENVAQILYMYNAIPAHSSDVKNEEKIGFYFNLRFIFNPYRKLRFSHTNRLIMK